MTPQAQPYKNSIYTFFSLSDDTYLQWPPGMKQAQPRIIGIGATGIRQASGVGVRFALYGRVKVPLVWASSGSGDNSGGGGWTWWKDRDTKHPNFMVAADYLEFLN